MGKPEDEPLLTPEELAALMKVDVKTTARWAKQGRLHTLRTMGGHRRFFENEVKAHIRGEKWDPPEGVTLETEQHKAA